MLGTEKFEKNRSPYKLLSSDWYAVLRLGRIDFSEYGGCGSGLSFMMAGFNLSKEMAQLKFDQFRYLECSWQAGRP